MAHAETNAPGIEWASDSAKGRRAAAEAISRATHTDSPMPITQALRDIIERGVYDGFAIGFAFELAERAR